MSPQLWKELVGEEPAKKTSSVVDGESVALWNPDWQVLCPPFEGAPQKLNTFAGVKNVLMTHPASEKQGAALERFVDVPAGKPTALKLKVAAHEQGDWELRVLANNRLLRKQKIDRQGEPWKTVTVDLSQFAGTRVQLRLENFANGWSWEFAYWGDIMVSHDRAL